MKIAHICGTFPPYYGGIGLACYYSALELAKLGNDVSVFTSNYPKVNFSYNESLKVNRLNPLFTVGKSPILPSLMWIKGFDIIHLHYPFYFGSEFIYFSSLFHNFKFVLTYHMDVPLCDSSIDHRQYPSLALKLHEKQISHRILSAADKIVITSKDLANNSRFNQLFRARSTDVVEIPLGVDATIYTKSFNKQALRSQLGIGENELILLFVGALDKQHYFKGVTYLLEAFSMIIHERNDIKLLIVGDGDLKDYYLKLAVKYGIKNKTIFAGKVPSVAPYYAVADISILPSTDSESFGIVLVEAMASGKPVIASNLPGVRSVVDDNENGLLVRPCDAIDLMSKVLILINDSEKRIKFGQNGRRKVLDKYSWDKIALSINNLYLKILE